MNAAPLPCTNQEADETHVTFSVRIPTHLVKQIDARAAVKKISRTKEVEALVDYAIDHSAHMDNQILEQLQVASVTK